MAMPTADFSARLAVAEERLSGQSAEIQRVRERLHLVEGDRVAIRLAVSTLRELKRDMPKIAQDAAERATAISLKERDIQHHQSGERRRVNFRDLSLLIFCGLSVASFLLQHHLL
jgi:septation ring formation regulator EzrA